MSGSADMDDPPLDLAAEYVLGTLDTADAGQAERRALTNPAFAAEIRFWEARLMPLTALAAPEAPPPALWARIEDTTGGARNISGSDQAVAPRAVNDNALRWWRGTAVAGLAVAAGLAAFIAVRPPLAVPVPAPVFAVLAPAGTTAPVLVALAGPNGSILVRASASISVAADRDLQLWSLPAGAAKPTSLGLLPPSGTLVPPGVAPGTQLLVSLEPKGGSPTGLPTGPVVYGGTLRLID